MITVSLACGHGSLQIDAACDTPPVCAVCGEHRVSRVTAPAPKFRGAVRGPNTVYEPGAIGPLALAIPLKLKESV